jgi:hypothetical protein
MKRIAAPMIGGVVTSAILELLIYPVIFVIWKRRSLVLDGHGDESPLLDESVVASEKRQRVPAKALLTVLVLALLGAGGYFAWQKPGGRLAGGAAKSAVPLATQQVDGVTATLSTPTGELRSQNNEVFIEFRNADGKPVDVGNVKLELNMNMPGMVMHAGGAAERDPEAGRYHTKVKPDMAGDWTTTLTFDGPAGKGQTSFALNVKP